MDTILKSSIKSNPAPHAAREGDQTDACLPQVDANRDFPGRQGRQKCDKGKERLDLFGSFWRYLLEKQKVSKRRSRRK